MSQVYSFSNVVATLSGPSGSVNLGFGAKVAKEGITITRAADINRMIIGADGEGLNSTSADRSGQCTIRLLKNAPANQVLMAIANAQRLDSSLAGNNIILIRQTVSNDIHTLSGVAFKKLPDIHYAEEGDMYEWAFDVVKMDSVLGSYS